MALTLTDDLVAMATAVGVLRDNRPPKPEPSPFFLRLIDAVDLDPDDLFGPITLPEEKP